MLLSEISIAERDLTAAQTELAQAQALSPKDPSRETRWAIQVGTARVNASTGAVEEAIRSLRSVLNEMAHLGYVTRWMDTRLALCQIDARAGKAASQADLISLEREANAKGFLFVANQAAETRKNHIPSGAL